jgi:hypothetical protein
MLEANKVILAFKSTQFNSPSFDFEEFFIWMEFLEICQRDYLFIFTSSQYHVAVLRREKLSTHLEVALDRPLHSSHWSNPVKSNYTLYHLMFRLWSPSCSSGRFSSLTTRHHFVNFGGKLLINLANLVVDGLKGLIVLPQSSLGLDDIVVRVDIVDVARPLESVAGILLKFLFLKNASPLHHLHQPAFHSHQYAHRKHSNKYTGNYSSSNGILESQYYTDPKTSRLLPVSE